MQHRHSVPRGSASRHGWCLHHDFRATSSISLDLRVRGLRVNPSYDSSTINPSAAHSSARRVAVNNLIRCDRLPGDCPPLCHRDSISRIPESGSNDRSCAIVVPSLVSHQSRARKRAMTPSRLPPCQTSTPPGQRTRENSRITLMSSAGLAKNPKDVKRLSTASNFPLHRTGSFLMSPRV